MAIGVLIFLAGSFTIGMAWWAVIRSDEEKGLGLPVFLAVVGALFFLSLIFGGAQIPATHIGVVENTATGELFSIGPGFHIWPFSPYVTPFITKVTSYDLRRRIIEIGADPVREAGVQADSNSPGRPVVYFQCRGWAYPSRDNIIELHRRYGKKYLDDWVERVWVSELKAVQGSKPYDYVGNNRILMQDEVERSLQAQLLIDDVPLVVVDQLAIVDFDYDEKVNSYLDTVAQQEFTRQQAEQQIEINRKLQDAAKIEADTAYLVQVRAAEASRQEVIAMAEGDAQATKVNAEAEAFAIRARYDAEADGIKKVQSSITSRTYLDYVALKAWSGEYPHYYMGDMIPLVQLPVE